MATIIHIIVSLTVAILRGFAEAFVLLFSRALLLILGLAGAVIVILFLTGTLSFGLRRKG